MSVQVRVEDRIATVTLDRPEALNAIDAPMRQAIRETWRRIAEDDAIAVAVVTGAGERAFSAGADMKESQEPGAHAESRACAAGKSRSLTDGMEIDKPLVAAINGHALGGGLEIALACDIRIAVPEATFGLPEVRVGTLPGSGGTQRLPRLIARSDALLMLLTGERIDAAEALRVGLVSRVVPRRELMPTARAIAARIAANAPLSVRAVKRLVRQGMALDLAAALEAEQREWAAIRETEDRAEGRRAFAERREPRYKGK